MSWTRWLLPVFLLNSFPYEFFADWVAHLPDWATILGLLDFVGSLLLLVLAQIYRYWRVSTPVQREQTKWILFSLSLGIVSQVGVSVLGISFPSLNGSLYDPANAYLSDLSSLLFPIAFAVAILRYRLWDIDTLINRTLVYGALTASVVGIYILVVGYLGAIFHTGGNLLISLIATSLVAVLFQPLRGWLQRSVNRLVYGQRDEPYVVVTQLSRRLESIPAPDAVLPTIAETVAKALKLPYVAIALDQGEEMTIAAAYGTPVEGVLTLPLIYQAASIGNLALGPRQRGEAFTPADRRLLDDLARQVGLAAHAVRLTTDLQWSREHLVTAREEERRRLRQDPLAADAEILDLQAGIRSTMTDIRRLVYALRPPTLDEFGLVGAIRQYALQYDTPNGAMGESEGRLRVVVESPEHLPALPTAVEVAAYRVVQEALTNVVRHAQATVCHLCLSLPDDKRVLQLDITDDGVGLPKEPPAGVGLFSMRERAEEVGGSCVITSMLEHGTQVLIRLPLPEE